MTPLRSLSFDTEPLEPAQRFSAWASALPFYEVEQLPESTPERFQCRSTAWWLGSVILTQSQLSEVRWRRSTARIRADGADSYNFMLLTSGSWSGVVAGRSLVFGAGQLCCFDLSQTFEGTSTASASLAISIARSDLDHVIRAENDLHGRIFDGPSGTLLVDHLLALERQLPHFAELDTRALNRAILAQFSATIEIVGRVAPATAVSDLLQQKARRMIDRQMTRRDLTPATLANDLNVTRSTLYKIFEPQGGVSAYIQRRRLEAVRMLLSDPSETRSISEMADTFGFSDASHFTAAFRRAFGITPRDMRRLAGRADEEVHPVGEPTERFRRWNRKLQGRTD